MLSTLSTQANHEERELVINGEVLGTYGVGINPVTPSDNNGAAIYQQNSQFDLGFKPITGSYPNASVGTYTVAAGDTLDGIAANAYGDSQQWWRIAQANGLNSNADLRVGTSIVIPSAAAGAHNNVGTFEPYDPSKIVGNTSPNLPAPPPPSHGGCGAVGMIVMVVVAVVATVVTCGVLGPVIAAAMGPALATLATVATGAIAGAIGSIASQLVGDAIGASHGFSWKAVATSAIGGAVTAGIGNIGSNITGAIETAAVDSVVTQGVDVMVGLQKSFSWSSLATSVVAAGVNSAVSSGVSSEISSYNQSLEPGDFSIGPTAAKIISGTVGGFAGGVAASLSQGGKINVVNIAADAFGNALGGAIGEALAPAVPQMSQDDFRRSEIQQSNADAMIQQGIDQSDAIQRRRFEEMDARNAMTQQGIDQSDAIQQRRFAELEAANAATAGAAASTGYDMDSYGVPDRLASKPGVKFRVGNTNRSPADASAPDGISLKMDLNPYFRSSALAPASAAGAPALTPPTHSWFFSDNDVLVEGKQTAVNILVGATDDYMKIAQDPKAGYWEQFAAQQSAGYTGYVAGMAQLNSTTPFGLTMDLAGIVPILSTEAKLSAFEKLARFGPDLGGNPFLADMAISSGSGREFVRSPGQILWVDENAGMNDVARAYNDSATGARSNLATEKSMAPAIYRSTPDGVGTIVKFDGVEDGVLIDRKVSVVTTDKAKDQALRQSQALTENGLTARWEVPTQAQANRAAKMFLELDIKNITPKVVPKNGTP